MFLLSEGQYSRSDVDGFWIAWSKGADEGLFRAYCRAGGPTAAEVDAFFGWGAVRIRRRRLSGKSVGGSRGTGASRLYRVRQGDVVDASSAQFFVDSPLARVLLFRGRHKSVADVLRGIKQYGFTQTRWDALHRYWGDLHGFYRWVFDALGLRNDFVEQLVTDRREAGSRGWAA